MFKNHAFQVKMIKDKKNGLETEPLPVHDNVETVAQAAEATKFVVREGTKLVATYLVLDTFRKLVLTLADK